jgi:branched-subunit amino acid transport protein
MTTVVALVLVGAASMAFRLAPLLGASRLPEQAARTAGWAGLGVLVAITVRAVLHHDAPGVDVPVAVAAVAVGCGLLQAHRGRSIPVVLLSGAAVYTAATVVTRAL